MHFPREREVHRNDIILMYSTIVYICSEFKTHPLVKDVTDRELDRIGRVEACVVGKCLGQSL